METLSGCCSSDIVALLSVAIKAGLNDYGDTRLASKDQNLFKGNIMSVKHLEDIPLESISAGEKTFKQVLISDQEGPNFAMRRFVIEAGGFMPLHTNSVEHEQFCLGGVAEVVIGECTIIVKKNDVVFIPARVAHSYKTLSNEAFEFLCLIPNLNDIIELKG